jgi:hypothetical protein
MGYEDTSGMGAVMHYGPRTLHGDFGGIKKTEGTLNEVEYIFDYSKVPATADVLAHSYPAYAKIVSVVTEIIGTVTLGGDRTGITVQHVVGSADTGADAAGALTRGTTVVDATLSYTSVGASAAKLATTLAATGGTTGAITAGKFRVIVKYVTESVDNNL